MTFCDVIGLKNSSDYCFLLLPVPRL